MIYCIIKGKKGYVQYTYPNNSGQITLFFYTGKGTCHPRSFNLNYFNSVEDYLINEFGARIINEYLYNNDLPIYKFNDEYTILSASNDIIKD